MGLILGMLIILALYFTIFCFCKYKSIDGIMGALCEEKKDSINKKKNK